MANEGTAPILYLPLKGKLADRLCDISQGSRVYLLVIKILYQDGKTSSIISAAGLNETATNADL